MSPEGAPADGSEDTVLDGESGGASGESERRVCTCYIYCNVQVDIPVILCNIPLSIFIGYCFASVHLNGNTSVVW